jgi:hypothetical protein
VSETLPALDAPNPHPVHLVVTDDLRRNRLTVFFRAILAIPLFVWLAIWGLAVSLVVLVAWVVGLIVGRVPDPLHSFMASFTRYYTHVSAYICITADPYPGFTPATGYPVDLVIPPATTQSRLTILFRIILAIPAAIVAYVLQQVASIVAILAWFYALFTGQANKGMRDLQAYCIRYQAQTHAYLLLLTQRYPSFSDD